MTNSFNPSEMIRLANVVSTGQEFMLEDIHMATRAAYEKYPEDPIINQVAVTIERMASKSPKGTVISQADISGIYNQFVRLSSNSKFRQVLGHLLLNETPNSNSRNEDYVRMNRVDAETSGISVDDFVDKNLVGALNTAFGNSFNDVKAFDQNIANNGTLLVNAELKSLGFNNVGLEVMGGNLDNIVYAAHFETRKGRVTVAIPTEVNNGRILFPSTFVADNQLRELTQNNLSYFVDAKAEVEDFSVPNANSVLAAVGIIQGRVKTASSENFDQISELFGQSDSIDMSVPSLFVDRQYESGRPDIDTRVDVKMPNELAHLARDFENSVLEAVSDYGLDNIRKGKNMIAEELRTAGFKNAQVRFGSESGGFVIYLASINTPKGPTEIEVPVEMKLIAKDKYVPLTPSYFAYDGIIEDFTSIKLQRFAVNLPSPSSYNRVYSSAYAYMTLPELKDEIIKSASIGDYVSCEAALSEVQDKFSEENFKNIVADYHYILMHKARIDKKEHSEHKCAKLIAAGKGSIYSRCGHFGVPLHEVITDESGNCRRKVDIQREALNKSEDGGAAISSAKVFMA